MSKMCVVASSKADWWLILSSGMFSAIDAAFHEVKPSKISVCLNVLAGDMT